MNRSRRQYRLLLIAVVLPALLLAVLAVRFLRQEKELTQQGAATERSAAVEQVRRELSAQLEKIAQEEFNRRNRELKSPSTALPMNSAIVLVAQLNKSQMILPWPSSVKPFFSSPPFSTYRDSGEMKEFQSKDLAAAISDYRNAVTVAKVPREACEARLLLARSLIKADRRDEAAANYRTMLDMCGSTADDAGIPFTLYAAERLVELKLDPPLAEKFLVNLVHTTHWRSMVESSMIGALLQSEPARQELAAQVSDTERASALARDLGSLQPKVETSWVAYGPSGNAPWLVYATQEFAEVPPLLFVIASDKVALPGVQLMMRPTSQSQPLGAGFSGLEMEFSPPRNFSPSRISPSSYAAGIGIVLLLTVFCGYLLLRGVNRDLEMVEMRSQFAASVSHELRTPLTAIRMFAETLVLGRTGDETTRSEYLETIMNESERLARLVDNVLEFSKIEEGRKIYRLKPTLLADVVHSAARAMQYPLSQQGFNLDISVDTGVPMLPADADAMEQAILNLLSNAMKYSGDARNVELRLELERRAAAIKVVDHGIGIAPTDRQHIFDKFYRVRSHQTDLIAGTGLGLTLVKHIAESHGGNVEVQSAVGSGSTFTIRIPIIPVGAEAAS